MAGSGLYALKDCMLCYSNDNRRVLMRGVKKVNAENWGGNYKTTLFFLLCIHAIIKFIIIIIIITKLMFESYSAERNTDFRNFESSPLSGKQHCLITCLCQMRHYHVEHALMPVKPSFPGNNKCQRGSSISH